MITRDDVKRAIHNVRKFHALGQKALLPKGKNRKPEHRALTESKAQERGVTLPTWVSTRQFAETFSQQDLDRLCRQIETQVNKSGHVFGKSAAILLVRVPVKSRWTFLESAIRGGWSAHRIKFEIAQQFGTRWGGGRRPLMPVDEAGVCQLLKKLCERWRRLNRELTRERTELQGVSLQEIALPVRKAFSSAITDLERLQKAATARLKKLQSKQS